MRTNAYWEWRDLVTSLRVDQQAKLTRFTYAKLPFQGRLRTLSRAQEHPIESLQAVHLDHGGFSIIHEHSTARTLGRGPTAAHDPVDTPKNRSVVPNKGPYQRAHIHQHMAPWQVMEWWSHDSAWMPAGMTDRQLVSGTLLADSRIRLNHCLAINITQHHPLSISSTHSKLSPNHRMKTRMKKIGWKPFWSPNLKWCSNFM